MNGLKRHQIQISLRVHVAKEIALGVLTFEMGRVRAAQRDSEDVKKPVRRRRRESEETYVDKKRRRASLARRDEVEKK